MCPHRTPTNCCLALLAINHEVVNTNVEVRKGEVPGNKPSFESVTHSVRAARTEVFEVGRV